MKKFLLIFSIIFFGVSWVAAQISFQAIPQKKEVGPNEPIRIQFILSIKNKDIRDIGNIKLPTFANTQVVGRQVIQNQSYDEDGNAVIEYGEEIILRAIKTGNLRVGGAIVIVDGKTYTTKPVTISVLGSSNIPEEGSAVISRMGEVFLALRMSEKNPYHNEGVVAQLKFYTRRVELLNSMTNLTPPNFKGFFVQPVKERNNTYEQEIINGDLYFSRVIGSYVMFPSKPGTMIIDPFTLTLTIPDGFFDEHEINIKSAPVTLQVRKLPEGSPKDFYGLVGEYKMKASSNKKELKAEEAVTIHLEISGYGNIALIKSPELSVPEGIEKYNPKSKLESEVTLNGVIGKLTTSTILVPQKGGDYNVKVKMLSYFDPKEGVFKQLSVDPVTFKVSEKPVIKDEGASNLTTARDSGNIKSYIPDLHVENVIPEVFERKYDKSKKPWIILFVGVSAVTIGIICLGFMKKKKSKQKETKKQKLSKSEEKIKFTTHQKLSEKSEPKDFVSELFQLKKIAEKGEDKKEFYTLLETILQEVANQSLNIKEGQFVPSVDVEEKLSNKFGDELSEDWKNMLLKSQIERYSNLSDKESLESVYSKAEELIKTIN